MNKLIIHEYEKEIAYYDKYFKMIEKDFDNQYLVAISYLSQASLLYDPSKSLQLLSDLVNKNNFQALNMVILFYLGNEEFFDIDQACKYIDLGIDKGLSDSYFYKAIVLFENGKIDEGIYNLHLGIQRKSSKCSYYMGMLYLDNKYTPKDVNKALEYFLIGADKNDGNCLFEIGKIFMDEHLGYKDYQGAFDAFLKGMEVESGDCYGGMGVLLIMGMGCDKSILSGINHLEKGRMLMSAYSTYQLGLIYYLGDVVKENIDKSLVYLEEAFNWGYIDAEKLIREIKGENE